MSLVLILLSDLARCFQCTRRETRKVRDTGLGKHTRHASAKHVRVFPEGIESGERTRAGQHAGWRALDYGLDQGPVVLMIENYRSGLVWQLMRECPSIVTGLRRAGFTGGWLGSASG
jgi:hypothetical protein